MMILEEVQVPPVRGVELKEGETLVAVYGTLKRGKGNWAWALKDRAEYLGTGRTIEKRYISKYQGSFPYVSESTHEDGVHVLVELFIVDNRVLASLDSLEGYRADSQSNFYNRISIPVWSNTHKKVVHPNIYVRDVGLTNETCHPDGNWHDTTIEDEVSSPNFNTPEWES
jgi:gamma-glutamylcyclotransferase (GGCT)/AIG2-like uncharacterized protein YtfP